MSKWSQQLEEDLNWRETELTSLKLEVVRATKGSVKHKSLLRAMWALLYAHYEGFCKFAWDLYINELKQSGVKIKDCKENIAILSLEKEFKQFRGDLSSTSIWEFGQTGFKDLLEQNLDFKDYKVDTKSNLYPETFREISKPMGLICTKLEEYEFELKRLVGRRNQIAHGQKLEIKSIEEYKKYEEAALLVMYELAILIVECLDNKLYLSP